MQPNDIQTGVNYFGRTVIELRPMGNAIIVEYEEDGKQYQAGGNEFCSWVHVAQGSEPTDAWHALCVARAQAGRTGHKCIEINGKVYRWRRDKPH